MAAVTQGRPSGLFAQAPGNPGGFGNLVLDRRDARPLVAAVAERLAGGMPAGAPPVGARLNLLHARTCSSDFWTSHQAGSVRESLIGLKKTRIQTSEGQACGSGKPDLRATRKINPKRL